MSRTVNQAIAIVSAVHVRSHTEFTTQSREYALTRHDISVNKPNSAGHQRQGRLDLYAWLHPGKCKAGVFDFDSQRLCLRCGCASAPREEVSPEV